MSVLISPGRVHTFGLALNLYLGSFVSPDVVLAILVSGEHAALAARRSFLSQRDGCPQKFPYAHLHFQVGDKPGLTCIFGRSGWP